MTHLGGLRQTLNWLISPRRWSIGLKRTFVMTLPLSAPMWVVAITALYALRLGQALLIRLVEFCSTAEPGERPRSLSDRLLPPAKPPIPLHKGVGDDGVPRLNGQWGKQPVCCRLGLHQAPSRHVRNMGWDFGRCVGCATELVRIFGGEWQTVPKGYRIVYMSRAEREKMSETTTQRLKIAA